MGSVQLLATSVGLDSRKSFNSREFCDAMAMLIQDVSVDELKLIFDFLDQNGDGTVSVDEFVAALTPAAPRLDAEQQTLLARLTETQHQGCGDAKEQVSTDDTRSPADSMVLCDLELGIAAAEDESPCSRLRC